MYNLCGSEVRLGLQYLLLIVRRDKMELMKESLMRYYRSLVTSAVELTAWKDIVEAT